MRTLVEAGFGVFSIISKHLDRFRDRFTVAAAKEDARDALICELAVYRQEELF